MGSVRLRRIGVVALTAAAAMVTAVLATPSTASAAGDTAGTYYKAVHLCRVRPAAGHAACLAIKRVKVSRGTPGAQLLHPLALPAGPAGGYTPGDLAKAYGVNAAAATTQTVAIVDAYDDPNALADLNTFDSHYGLPAETSTSFKKVSQTGSTTTFPTADSGWAGEESLDVDAVRGICHACKIILVEANSNNNDDLAAAVNEAVTLKATIVSNSYGGQEPSPPDSTVLAAYNHPGVVILASSGDDGYYSWDNVNNFNDSDNTPEAPASYNTVVAVGGTSLYLNDDGTRASETVWNNHGPGDIASNGGAGGGGCSTIVNAQNWQKAVPNWAGTACGARRLSTDISAVADPFTGFDYYDTYQSSGWQTIGGTSLASPVVAGLWGLAGGAGGVRYPSLSLYGHYQSTPGSLYDVTSGANGYCRGMTPSGCSSFSGGVPNTWGYGVLDCAWNASGALAAGRRACNAMTGYDGPSGVGTPIGLTAFKAMAPTATITAPATITHGTAASFTGSATDPFPGGSITSWAWTFGDGGTAATQNASHTYAAAGTYTVTLKATDNYGRVGTVTKTVTVH